MDIPSRQDAKTKEVTIPVSTTVDGEKQEAEFQAELPASLSDAIALEGEKEVFKRFINSYVVYLQGLERNKLQSKGGGTTRVRARYMEELGL